MDTIKSTSIWENTLAPRDTSEHGKEARDRLRTSFRSFREKAKEVAADIRADQPEFTVHDIRHLDALWEMADIIAGENFELNPMEAYVFGGSVLLHDLGMTLAAYPGGLDELREQPEWDGFVASQFRKKLGREPEEEEIANPPDKILREATALILRDLHASRAEELAFTSWSTDNEAPDHFLIEDHSIRQKFGRLIGQIAHSHWWSIDKIEDEFGLPLGVPHWCPNDWTVDPLKVACLLRVADISHIDSRRAPSFLRALRQPGPYADEHWKFQEKLQTPYPDGDALAYTSGFAFPIEDSDSWWLCLETLQRIDRELRQVDALLADTKQLRLKARRVAGIESPDRLVSYIPTDGWKPIDAVVHVSDVPAIVEKLGGENLYGNYPQIALRELIQNAADAVRARRVVEERSSNWGEITIRLGQHEDRHWIEVNDSGIGMSEGVLTDYLLDFGGSYWGSSLMREEFPELLTSELNYTGTYGIGFFSILMMGDLVEITTRRSSAAQEDTLVLELQTDLGGRPIVRNAKVDEQLIDGGTSVRVWLSESPESDDGFLGANVDNFEHPLEQLCKTICPSLDVDVFVENRDSTRKIITARDWISVEGEELIGRIDHNLQHKGIDRTSDEYNSFVRRVSNNLEVIEDENGNRVGRAAICVDSYETDLPSLNGVITVGGLKSRPLTNITGILTGKSQRVVRDKADPVVSVEKISEWATKQADKVTDIYSEPKVLLECAQVIWMLGGDTRHLPLGHTNEEWYSFDDIVEKYSDFEYVFLVSGFFEEMARKHNRDINFYEKSIASNINSIPAITQTGVYFGGRKRTEWPSDLVGRSTETLVGPIANALASAWDEEMSDVLERSYSKYEDRVEREIGTEDESPVTRKVRVIERASG